MDSFISVAGWTQHANSTPSRPFGHFRSLSAITSRSSSPNPARHPGKTPSTSELPEMPATATPPASSAPLDEGGELSTLPDPRSRAMSPVSEGGDGADASSIQHHPDLNEEIATLSTKLVNAINRQTTLDDSLSATRLELEAARERIRSLEEQNASQREMLAGDVWVRRKTVETEKKTLLGQVTEEKKLRQEAEKEKRRIEQELESLTAALFEEANKMVVQAKEEAKKEHDALQRKNDQLRAQLADTEGLLESQREQLSELKTLMEQLSVERDESPHGTAPSSPGFSKFDASIKEDESSLNESAATSPHVDPVTPTYPTSFTHLIQPVLRTDLGLYDDFTGLVRQSRRRSGSRVSSGVHPTVSYSAAMGMAGSVVGTSSAHPSNASTASLSTIPSPATVSTPQTPNTPASAVSTGASSPGPAPSLKESKFFRRVLTEDVEPTLRLDLAPGLSWLARRGVLNAMTEGTMVVEPAPAKPPLPAMISPQHHPCSLCGETRKDIEHLRTHRFRTTESDSAQRYPLCRYCLNRVRSTCDFLGFLRVLRDGHWRVDDEDAERQAWEESVRLREQMFWARIGGGVVPTGHPVATVSIDETSSRPASQGEPVGKPEATQPAPTSEVQGIVTAMDAVADETQAPEVAEETQTPASTIRNSTQSLEVKSSPGSDKESVKRLSITIPRVDQQ